ncbi:MAG: HAD family phosphatase [Selenomonadaceae bacterium]|nr:HAD family phosphatase [Selenomonadaceae bacterium]
MIKIIFCDMDGTLLTSNNTLPEGFDEIIAELKKRGVIFAPASGRQYFSLLKTFPQYKDEFIFLADNGTLVMRHGKEFFSLPMKKEIALEMLHEAGKIENILRVYCGIKNAYIQDFQDTPAYRVELNKYYTHSGTVKTWEEIDDIPIKVAFFDGSHNANEKIYKKLEKFNGEVQVLLSSDEWVDVMMPNVGKGFSVRKIQQMLDIKPEECAAFGDYLNDYDMLKSVGYSFAMANAHPDLKKIAKFKTASNDEGGVIVGIKKLIDDGLI